jgi:hypothetical protein
MAQATPEQADAGMQEWMAWAGGAGDAVKAVLDGHPHAAQGGTIEVHRFLDLPGM